MKLHLDEPAFETLVLDVAGRTGIRADDFISLDEVYKSLEALNSVLMNLTEEIEGA